MPFIADKLLIFSYCSSFSIVTFSLTPSGNINAPYLSANFSSITFSTCLSKSFLCLSTSFKVFLSVSLSASSSYFNLTASVKYFSFSSKSLSFSSNTRCLSFSTASDYSFIAYANFSKISVWSEVGPPFVFTSYSSSSSSPSSSSSYSSSSFCYKYYSY